MTGIGGYARSTDEATVCARAIRTSSRPKRVFSPVQSGKPTGSGSVMARLESESKKLELKKLVLDEKMSSCGTRDGL
jgi:hypothetical protein